MFNKYYNRRAREKLNKNIYLIAIRTMNIQSLSYSELSLLSFRAYIIDTRAIKVNRG